MDASSLDLRPVRGRRAIMPVATGLVAFVVSVTAIAQPSIWYDEAATVSSATRGWTQLFAEVQNVDAVHALYYAFMHIWFDALGYSPFTLRLPSALAVGIATGLLVVLGRRLGSERYAVTAALLFAVLPRTVWAGGEGRSYALTIVAAVLLTLALVRALRHGRARDWVLYGVLAALGCLFFLYLALIVLAHAVTVAALGRRARGRWIGFVIAAASAGVAVAPAAAVMMAQSRQIGWLGHLGFPSLGDVATLQWFLPWPAYAAVAWAVLVIGAVIVVRARRADDRAVILLPLVVLPPAVLLAATALGHPVYFPRYLSMCLPFVALLAASAMDRLPRRAPRVAAIALVLALAVPVVLTQRATETKENSSWREVATWVDEHKARDGSTAILYGSVARHRFTTARAIATAYPADFAGTLDPTFLVSGASTGTLWDTSSATAESLGRLEHARSIYLVTSTVNDPRPSTSAVLARIGFVEKSEERFTWVRVVEYERAPGR